MRVKRGQIAHLDGRNSNNSLDNLTFLCLLDHADYDAKARQWKGFTISEVKTFRRELVELTNSGGLTRAGGVTRARSRASNEGITLALYDRRIEVYRLMRAFIDMVMREATVDLPPLLTFRKDIDEAIFLFDETVFAFAQQLFTRGVALRRTHMLATNHNRTDEERDGAWGENADHLKWFSEQYAEMRMLLYRRLRPSSS